MVVWQPKTQKLEEEIARRKQDLENFNKPWRPSVPVPPLNPPHQFNQPKSVVWNPQDVTPFATQPRVRSPHQFVNPQAEGYTKQLGKTFPQFKTPEFDGIPAFNTFRERFYTENGLDSLSTQEVMRKYPDLPDILGNEYGATYGKEAFKASGVAGTAHALLGPAYGKYFDPSKPEITPADYLISAGQMAANLAAPGWGKALSEPLLKGGLAAMTAGQAIPYAQNFGQMNAGERLLGGAGIALTGIAPAATIARPVGRGTKIAADALANRVGEVTATGEAGNIKLPRGKGEVPIAEGWDKLSLTAQNKLMEGAAFTKLTEKKAWADLGEMARNRLRNSVGESTKAEGIPIVTGDTITDGLINGKVIGEGSVKMGRQDVPAWKIEILTGHEKGKTSVMMKDQSTLVPSPAVKAGEDLQRHISWRVKGRTAQDTVTVSQDVDGKYHLTPSYNDQSKGQFKKQVFNTKEEALAELAKRGNIEELNRLTKTVTPLKAGEAKGVAKQPLTLYRATNPGSTERISTGNKEWDSYLFASDNVESAKPYGSQIETVTLHPSAKVLYEGTAEFRKVVGTWRKGESMLDFASRSAKSAKEQGYDAVHFKRQSDIGTAILNKDAIAPLSKAEVPPAAVKEPWEMTNKEFVGEYQEPYSVKQIQDAAKGVKGSRQRFERRTGAMVPPSISGEIRGKLEKRQATVDEMRQAYRQYVDDYKKRVEEHYTSIANAVKQGKPVPAEVLKDYPDLAKRYGTTPLTEAEIAQGKARAVEWNTSIAKGKAIPSKAPESVVTPPTVNENLTVPPVEASDAGGKIFPSDNPSLEGLAVFDLETGKLITPANLQQKARETAATFGTILPGEGHDALYEAKAILSGKLDNTVFGESPRIKFDPTKNIFEIRYDHDSFLRNNGNITQVEYGNNLRKTVKILQKEYPDIGISIPEKGDFFPAKAGAGGKPPAELTREQRFTLESDGIKTAQANNAVFHGVEPTQNKLVFTDNLTKSTVYADDAADAAKKLADTRNKFAKTKPSATTPNPAIPPVSSSVNVPPVPPTGSQIQPVSAPNPVVPKVAPVPKKPRVGKGTPPSQPSPNQPVNYWLPEPPRVLPKYIESARKAMGGIGTSWHKAQGAFDVVEQANQLVLKARDLGTNTVPYVMSHIRRAGNLTQEFGLDSQGLATTVKNPQNRSLAINDVLSNPTHYNLTPAQKAIADAHGFVYREALKLAKSYGVKINEIPPPDQFWQYIARKVKAVKDPVTGKVIEPTQSAGGFKPGTKIGAQQERAFTEMMEGVNLGYLYEHPDEVMATHIQGIYRLIGNKQAEDLIKPLTRAITKNAPKTFTEKGFSDIPALQGRVATSDLADKIIKIFTPERGLKPLEIGAKVSEVATGQVAALDVSAPFLQGLFALGADLRNGLAGHPTAIWAKAYGKMWQGGFNPSNIAKYRMDNQALYKEAIEAGIMTGQSEFVTGVSVAQRGLEKVPTVGKSLKEAYRQSWGRAGEAYSDFLEVAKVEYYKSMKASWLREGGNIYDLGALSNRMMGSVSSTARGVGINRRFSERIAAFAPNYMRSSMLLLKDMMGRDVAASEVRKTLAAMLGVGFGVYYAEEKVRGQEPKIKSWAKKWGGDGSDAFTTQIGDTRIGLGSWMYGMVKLLADVTAQSIDDPSALVVWDNNHPVSRFLKTKRGAAVGLASDLATGTNFYGQKYDSHTDYLLRIVESLAPISAQSMITQEPKGDAAQVLAELQGLRAYPVTQSVPSGSGGGSSGGNRTNPFRTTTPRQPAKSGSGRVNPFRK